MIEDVTGIFDVKASDGFDKAIKYSYYMYVTDYFDKSYTVDKSYDATIKIPVPAGVDPSSATLTSVKRYSDFEAPYLTNVKGNVNSDGTYVRYFKACDAAGNCTAAKDFTIKLDMTAPTGLSLGIWTKSTTDSVDKPTNPSKQVSSGEWIGGTYGGKDVKAAIVMTVGGTDDGHGSGWSHWLVTSTGANTNVTDRKQTKNFRNVNANGKSTIKFKTCDKVGNCSSYVSVKVWVDRVKPSCDYTKSSTGEDGVSGKIKCSDSDSGCLKDSYKYGPIYKTTKIYEILDNAGNYNTCTVPVTVETEYNKETCVCSSGKYVKTSKGCTYKTSSDKSCKGSGTPQERSYSGRCYGNGTMSATGSGYYICKGTLYTWNSCPSTTCSWSGWTSTACSGSGCETRTLYY